MFVLLNFTVQVIYLSGKNHSHVANINNIHLFIDFKTSDRKVLVKNSDITKKWENILINY